MSQPFFARPWQIPAIDRVFNALATGNSLGLWSGMGTGKTSSCLVALNQYQTLLNPAPALITAPLRVAQSTWPAECAKWVELANMRVVPVVGTETQRRKALNRTADAYAINYEALPWLRDYLGESWPFEVLIADESTKLKSYRGSIQSRQRKDGQPGREFLRLSKTNRAGALANYRYHTIKSVIELTGTPAPNGLKDLWGQLWFLDMGQRLGRSHSAFIKRWFRKGFDGWALEPNEVADAEIKAAIADICLRIDLADYVDVAKPFVHTIEVDLPDAVRVKYKQVERDLFAKLRTGDVLAANKAVATMKALQFASGAVILESGKVEVLHDAKLDALDSIIEELNEEPLLIAHQFVSSRDRILKRFKGARVLDKDLRTVEDWNKGRIRLLLAHPASAGHGLNLQYGGSAICHFDNWWNAEERMQIEERIGPVRQMQAGLNRLVRHFVIVTKATADEDVLYSHANKVSIDEALRRAMSTRG